LVSKSARPSHSLSSFHTRSENLHWKIICAAVSGALLQSWQGPQLGHPLRMRRSAVHIRFCRINHAKVLYRTWSVNAESSIQSSILIHIGRLSKRILSCLSEAQNYIRPNVSCNSVKNGINK
jgi:hypothetical protein